MSKHAVLIATAKVRPGEQEAFDAWRMKHDAIVAKFPGYISSDMIPSGPAGSGEWTIMLNFESKAQLEAWQKSPERAESIGHALNFFEGGTFGQVVESDLGSAPGTNVTEVILSRVKPGLDARYREWAARIQNAQAKYAGYKGTYLQPPTGDSQEWTTLLRYDTVEHLEAWMASPERAELLAESKEFIESEHLMRLATSFPGWVPINPATGKGPPNWKTALLVLLGLFPVVMLEMKFLSPVLHALGIQNMSLATFIGNVGSVAITTYWTMPPFIRWFGWWLFLDEKKPTASITAKGCLILAGLFILEVLVLWKLIP